MSPISDQGHFTIWVLQIQQTVMMLLGKLVNPYTGQIERNLEVARWHIDLLSAIETRTKGNLDADEARLLGQVLTTLRLNYVEEAARPEPVPQGQPSDATLPDDGSAEAPAPDSGGEDGRS